MPSYPNHEPAVFHPTTLAELDDISRAGTGKLTYIAGGTDLMIQPEHWHSAENLVNLNSVAEMHRTIAIQSDGVLLGAAVPLSAIMAHAEIRQRWPILVAACRQIGSVQIQNRATLGGNIANASPAGDSLPVLSVLDAEIRIGPRHDGEFAKYKLDQVMTGPGETTLGPQRYIAFIFIPFSLSEPNYWYFRKVGQRQALAISKASLAVLGWIQEQRVERIRIASGSVSAQIRRATKTEDLLTGKILTAALIDQASQMLESEVAPITDIRSTREYRKFVCGRLLAEALQGMLNRQDYSVIQPPQDDSMMNG